MGKLESTKRMEMEEESGGRARRGRAGESERAVRSKYWQMQSTSSVEAAGCHAAAVDAAATDVD